MKTSELMICDWVKVTDKDEWFFGIVCGIDRDNVLVVKPGNSIGYPYAEECIEPVPLTPEILEKNGFEKNAMYYVLKIDEDFELWYYPHLGSFRYEYQGELIFKLAGGVNYVHSLQHALRLCGIDKEITL